MDSTYICMIRRGFLSPEDRASLVRLARSGKAEHRVARRANVLVLLDQGESYANIAKFLLLDDQTIRDLERSFETNGLSAVTDFHAHGGPGALTQTQQDNLKQWVSETLPRTTQQVSAYIEQTFGVSYESRSGVIKLLHRLGMEFTRPVEIARKLDPEKQQAFIAGYEKLMNGLQADEVVLFGDAVHPTHEVRAVGCWGPKDAKLAVEQTSGRQRLNVHGAIDLESGKTCMRDVPTVDALSTIALMVMIEAAYPNKRVIHLFLDNARYHHAKIVQEWLNRAECRIKLHFIPPYCPHLNPIERLWGQMHKAATHNKSYEKFVQFKQTLLHFLRQEIPANWHNYCDSISDRFRIIYPSDFRKVA
jgi:transposase